MAGTQDQPRMRPLIYGALAIVVAGAAGIGTWSVVHGYQQALDQAREPADTVEVVAAARDVNAGVILTESELVKVRIPASKAPAGEFFTDPAAVVGEVTVERVLAGEPIRKQRLTLGSGSPVPETMLESGTRAITVKVKREAGVGGFVRPGSYVDVIVTIRPDENALGANWVTETIIQAVRVLAIGEATVPTSATTAQPARKQDPNAARPRDVYATLEVEPEEAEKIAMATSRGELYLSLRALDDFVLAPITAPLVTNSLVGIDAKPAPARVERLQRLKAEVTRATPVADASHEAEVITGSSTRMERFEADGTPVRSPPKKGR